VEYGSAITFLVLACVFDSDCFARMVQFAEIVTGNYSTGPLTATTSPTGR
jgi:hypothetical protein